MSVNGMGSEFSGGLSVHGFEAAVKVGQVFEAGFLRNFQNGGGRRQEKAGGHNEAVFS